MKANKQPEHCCQLMEKYVDDKRVTIDYNPKLREYFIDLRYSTAVQGIVYCPWCATKLPGSLRDKWCEVLEKEYNIDDPLVMQDSKYFPTEFKTDEWWKKRNL